MKRLKKSSKDKSLHGVCGGIAEALSIHSLLVRLVFSLTMPASLIVYIILANTLESPPPTLRDF
ncbi:PspC domain-containing protein [Halobacillus campisalis]|uniref:PspC domain-containing protein n=1 Tax=Halobacillus campisalis TaxID=435909 RepID=A0ABW2K693_9BACI|nr:PspC domain-containing protein [Halobacillus campisalis]